MHPALLVLGALYVLTGLGHTYPLGTDIHGLEDGEAPEAEEMLEIAQMGLGSRQSGSGSVC